MQFAALWAWGIVVGLDLVSVGQLMFARPLVAGTVAGLILGDPVAGGTVGVILELFALDVLPVGAVRYPDYGIGAVAATAVAADAPAILGVGIAVALGLVTAYVGEVGIGVVRRANTADVRRHAVLLDAGDQATAAVVHRRGLIRDTMRSAVVTFVGLVLAQVIASVSILTVRAAVLASVVLVGAAIGTAAGGAMRLGGRGFELRWFVLGLVAGTIVVVAT